MIKYCFIILHYNNINDTTECIDSVRALNEPSKIVVVSNSKDIEQLQTIKSKIDHLIINEENVGFAKANNIGAHAAMELYHPDFLIVINNDIIMNDAHFLQQIQDDYNQYQFDALGPYIETDGGDSVNPFYTYDTLDEINEEIGKCKRMIRIYSNYFLRNVYTILRNIKHLFVKSKLVFQNGEQILTNVSLHGCAIIFSKKYYEKFEFPFYNETFLYHEEEFLSYRRKKHHLIFMYDPNLKVFHKEGASLKQTYQKNYKKLIFHNQERMKSLEKLKYIVENNIDI